MTSFWLTDRTPHEALPQTESGHRQFFRLVTSNISVWFGKHSTSNPNVHIPDNVTIIEDDKFDPSTPSRDDDDTGRTRRKLLDSQDIRETKVAHKKYTGQNGKLKRSRSPFCHEHR
jgi:hypothetical protein